MGEPVKQTAKNGIGHGKPGPGRPKGIPNKVTRQAKEAIALVFDALGGVDGLLKWAQTDPDNLKVFYTALYTKLVPLEVQGTHDVSYHNDEAQREAEERADRVIRQLAILSGTASLQDEPGVSADLRSASERLQ
jgi:hypothetical protein